MSRKRNVRQIFGQNLRRKRETLGISQEDLAEKAGLHRTYIGSVERGERNVSIDNMERLAVAVGSTIEQLLESWSREIPSRSSSLRAHLSEYTKISRTRIQTRDRGHFSRQRRQAEDSIEIRRSERQENFLHDFKTSAG